MSRFRTTLLTVTPVVASMIFATGALAAPAVTTALALQVTPATFASNAGPNAATGTVSRPGVAAGALAVTLKSGDTSLARVPATVTIPAGAASATFPISAVPSTVVRGTRKVHIQAAAAGYAPVRVLLTVNDATQRALRLIIRPRRFREDAGANAATGHVTRNTVAEDAQQPLVVTLQSSDTSQARVPASVTIPAGQQNVNFPVSAVRNLANRPRGMETLHILATAAGFQPATYAIVVTDVHTAAPVKTTTATVSLTLSVTPATVAATAGAKPAIATVTRSPAANTALVVTLRSSETSLARVPATVTISAGQASVTFPVSPVVDPALKGRTNTVHIAATAAGFPAANVPLTVTH